MTASPLFEIVDRGNDIRATGNDTVITLVAIAACIGLCFCMATMVVGLIGFIFSLFMLLSSEMPRASQPLHHAVEYELLLFSPPLSLTSLRI